MKLVIMSSIILHVTHLGIMSLFPKLFNLNGLKYYQHMSCVKQCRLSLISKDKGSVNILT